MDLYTIGHSTHTEEEFISLLKKYKIEVLVDVRSFPGSKHVPQFNQQNMEIWLPRNDIKCLHMPELGGRRNKNKEIDESLVSGWKSPSFRNYATYSLTQKYQEGIDRLTKLSNQNTLCYMCSEAVPWRCHRLIISNTLVSNEMSVYHIMTEKKVITHEVGMYGAKAIKKGSQLIYPFVEQ